ncbi:MAG: stage II sporulation protein P [Clostridia bacterium]
MIELIRIKVIEGSHLVLIVVAVLLAIALALAGFSYLAKEQPREATTTTQNVEAAAAFAAAASGATQLALPDEDEHTDAACDGFIVEVVPTVPDTPGAPDQAEAPLRSLLAPQSPQGDASGARVLIYHTHTEEAYAQVPGDPYVENSKWRTRDPAHSVVRVGDELAHLLGDCGIEVVHDTTDHEPPQLGTAYVRSLETLKGYPQPFDLYIDLHRDAFDQSMAGRAVSVGGAEAAQLMVLVGNGDGFREKPDTQANLAFAQALTARLNRISDGLCRDVRVQVGRYNQHIGTPAVLIEVGHNLNTLGEALSAMPVLARAISEQLAQP